MGGAWKAGTGGSGQVRGRNWGPGSRISLSFLSPAWWPRGHPPWEADGPALRPRSRRLAVREQREAVGGARGSESVKSGGGGPGKIELGRRWLPPCRKGTLGAQGTVGGGGQVSEVRLHSAWHGTLALGDRVGLQPYTPSGRPQLSSHLLVSPGPACLGARRRRRSAAGQAPAATPVLRLFTAPLRTARALTSCVASRSSAPWTTTTAIAKPPTARMFPRSHCRSGGPQPSRCTTL